MIARTHHMLETILAAIVVILGLTGTLMAQERILISSEPGEVTAELADNDAATSLLPHVAGYDPNASSLASGKDRQSAFAFEGGWRGKRISRRGRSGFGLRITLLSITVTAKSRSPASSFLDKRSVTLRFLTNLDRSLCVLGERNEQP